MKFTHINVECSYLQQRHILRLSLYHMRKKHVCFVRKKILFIHNTLHAKEYVCIGYIICYYRACTCILRVWEYSLRWLHVDVGELVVTFEAVDEFLDVIGSDWDSSLPFVVIFTQYSDGDIAVEKSRLDRRGATQKSTADSM